MNVKILILGLLVVSLLGSCDREVVLDKYFLGEKFVVTVDDPAIVVDTSTQVYNQEKDAWEYPEYLVEVKRLIYEKRCTPGSCSFCFGGEVKMECSITALSTNIQEDGVGIYPSCTEGDLSVEGVYARSILIDHLEFKCISILPYYDFPDLNIPLQDYQVKLITLKQ